MEVVVRITVGPSSYAHHVKKEISIELPDEEAENPVILKKAFRTAENNMKDLLRSIDTNSAAETIRHKREREEVTKELKAEMDKEVQASYKYTNEIDELKKEIRKRDCRLDGIIASRNPDYVPPSEDGEPQDLL